MDNNQLLGEAGAYWSKISDDGSFSQKISWGSSPIIRKYLCKKICGKSLDSPIKALFDRAKSLYNKIDYEIAVSVGCGDASRELSLLQQNIVQKFILFEISESRIKRIYEKAEELSLLDRITVYNVDHTEVTLNNEADLIFWCHSLHHMFDVHKSIEWSKAALKKGGLFAMYDFIGAARFQWSDEALDYASKIKSILPEELLYDPINKIMTDRKVKRPPRNKLIKRDPTEAVDSDRIIEGIKVNFNDCDVKYLGGIVFHLALNGLMCHFVDNPHTEKLLESFLIIDDLLSKDGFNNFATVLAVK